jgi:hypothetical protein
VTTRATASPGNFASPPRETDGNGARLLKKKKALALPVPPAEVIVEAIRLHDTVRGRWHVCAAPPVDKNNVFPGDLEIEVERLIHASLGMDIA